jgi:hypothetical protein
VLGKCRFSIVVLEVSYVFLEPSFEGSTCLARVRHLTVGVSQLVHATSPVFALGVVFLCEVFSDRIVCCECNCYVRVFKYFSDVTGFLPDIREPCPFFILCMCVAVFEFRYVMVWSYLLLARICFMISVSFSLHSGDSL